MFLQETTGGGLEAGATTTLEWSACGMSLFFYLFTACSNTS